jgi:hypothetical protein
MPIQTLARQLRIAPAIPYTKFAGSEFYATVI